MFGKRFLGVKHLRGNHKNSWISGPTIIQEKMVPDQKIRIVLISR